MAAKNTNAFEQVYNVREEENLLGRVALVVCAVTQREVFVAGFSITKELLTIHYTTYNSNRPVWELDFFEQVFASEPLLAVREKVKGVFVGSVKNMIVPDELYNEAAAAQWLQRLFFIERNDAVAAFALSNDKAMYVQSIPLYMAELIKINFRKSVVLPLSAYQFGERPAQTLHLQLCVGSSHTVATLHNYSQLLWHKFIDYATAEDIAWAIRLHCKENYIDANKLNITCNALSAAEYDVVTGLSAYFPHIKAGNGLTIHNLWDPAITLANQLAECVL
jgi:hypothetical protein